MVKRKTMESNGSDSEDSSHPSHAEKVTPRASSVNSAGSRPCENALPLTSTLQAPAGKTCTSIGIGSECPRKPIWRAYPVQ